MSRHASPHSPHRRAELAACQDVCALYHELNTSDRGLADDQVVLMRRQHGVNRLERERDTLPRCLARAFLNPFNLILIVLGVISLATDAALSSSYAHHVTTAAVIFVMVAVSGAVRLIEELRAKKAADQLGRLVRENVTVRRGGTLIEIPAEELVVGDLVTLSAGERVPADMRLVRSKDLFVSQAAITGESAAAEKHATSCAAGSTMPLTHCENLVFMATTVVGGDAEGIVVAVGADTLYGGLAGGDSVRGSFLAGTASIARVLVRFMVVLVPLIFVLIGVTGGNWLEAFVFALAVAVGLVPELLPMVVTACLAKGSLAMGRARVIVKNIDAMQGFGSIDVLCLDKTGTLTNESILLEYYLDVLGNEDARVLDAAFLNSSYHTGACNPIDNAILACETMPGRGTHFQELLAEHPKLDEIPFDHERRLTSALATRGDATVLIAKGDVESVVSRCSQVRHKDTLIPVSAGWEADVSAVVDEMRADGMKVIAVAERNLDARTTITPDDERDLTLIGYLAFFDAPKRTARASVEGLARLEVTPKVLTGDHADVATSICRRVGIPTDVVVRGAEIDAMDDAALTAAVERAHVFAELTPAHKARIVTSLRASGHIVGFLGDGLNDVPVLLAADVGISVDTAVDAAKDAADVVLLEKDLGVLERGILEGRRPSPTSSSTSRSRRAPTSATSCRSCARARFCRFCRWRRCRSCCSTCSTTSSASCCPGTTWTKTKRARPATGPEPRSGASCSRSAPSARCSTWQRFCSSTSSSAPPSAEPPTSSFPTPLRRRTSSRCSKRDGSSSRCGRRCSSCTFCARASSPSCRAGRLRPSCSSRCSAPPPSPP